MVDRYIPAGGFLVHLYSFFPLKIDLGNTGGYFSHRIRVNIWFALHHIDSSTTPQL